MPPLVAVYPVLLDALPSVGNALACCRALLKIPRCY